MGAHRHPKDAALDLAFVDTIATLLQCSEYASRDTSRKALEDLEKIVRSEVCQLLAAIGNAGTNGENTDARWLLDDQIKDVFDGEFLSKWRAEAAEKLCRELEAATPEDRAAYAADVAYKERREHQLMAAE